MVEGANIICRICSNAAATIQCLCETPPTYLCSPCIPAHLVKPATHKVLPIAPLPEVVIAAPKLFQPPPPPMLPELQALQRPMPPRVFVPPPAPVQMLPRQPSIEPTKIDVPTEVPVDIKMPQQDREAEPVQPLSPLPPPKSSTPVPRRNNKAEEKKQRSQSKMSKKEKKAQKMKEKKQMQHSEPGSPKGFKPTPTQPLASEPASPAVVKLKNPCYSCEKAEATVVLTCFENPQMCCDKCAEKDENALPLCTFPKLTSPGVVSFAVDRYKFVKATKVKLQANFTQIDNFLKKSEIQFAKCIKEIEECKNRIFAKVRVIRTDIEKSLNAGLAEVEENLCNEKYRPKGEYALVLWEKRVEDTNFDLFVSRCSAPDIVGEITRTIDYEVRGLFALNCLPVITDDKVLKFNCQRLNWSPPIALDKPVKVSSHTVLTYVGKQDVLCSGFYEEGLGASGEAFLVNIATGYVEMLPSMENPRFHQGTICVGRNVYMFGGQNPDYMNSCEKYCLDHKQDKWSQLKEMLSLRASFNPLLHERLIYILGGANTRDSELYDFVRNNFLPLCFLLPTDAPVAAVELSQTIMIVQKSKVHVWVPTHKSIKYKSLERRGNVQREKEEEECAWSNFTPLVVKGVVYLMSNERREVVEQELGGRYDFHTFKYPREEAVTEDVE